MKKTITRLADGRELIYYDRGDAQARGSYVDARPLTAAKGTGQTRLDPVLGEWVSIAEARNDRTFMPPPDMCPLCPTRDGRLSEIPAPDYEVVVFENRFPSLRGAPADEDTLVGPLPHRAHEGGGRCEVVCFTAEHDATFATLGEDRALLVLEAWTDRTAELSALPGIRQVYVFENRGIEIGVSLTHPHGQVYAFPYVAPKTARAVENAAAHRARTGRNLFDDLLAAEREGPRLVAANEEWTAFVPFAARWPYELHLYPNRRVRDFTGLDEAQRAAFPSIYLDILGRFGRLFQPERAETPYIAAWHQAPTGADSPRSDADTADATVADSADRAAGSDLALHLELFTVRRAADKLKYLAGTESGMGAFMNDVSPERAADRLREVAS